MCDIIYIYIYSTQTIAMTEFSPEYYLRSQSTPKKVAGPENPLQLKCLASCAIQPEGTSRPNCGDDLSKLLIASSPWGFNQ